MLRQAKEAGVYVVKEEFIEASKKGGAALLIASHSLCDWGTDVSQRVYILSTIANCVGGPEVDHPRSRT